ncbi:hypothetical protein TNCV_4155711 [Trichonephila clavipes]|nr:hypothetical protein TNCV_4155711 [Trichonephila clavipes]
MESFATIFLLSVQHHSHLHKLKLSDCDKRLTFVLSFLAKVKGDDDSRGKIYGQMKLITHHLDASVNTQYCRIWASEQHHEVQEIPMHSAKVTVWSRFPPEFLGIGPFY